MNRYTASSKKTGFYIRANVGGHHPVTLQATQVSEQIFQENGYRDGSSLPTKLVWGMYDVGLLYTEASLSGSTPSYSVKASLTPWMESSVLTEATRQKLIKYLSSYSGSQQAAVKQLLKELRRELNTSRNPSKTSFKGTASETLSATQKAGETPKTTGTRFTKTDSSGTYISSEPWRKQCPFCRKKVHYSEDALIQHWAHSSSCSFSKDESRQIETINSDWDSIVRKVERERKQQRQSTPSYSECPYCSAELEHRSANAYLLHWTDGSCAKQLESLPEYRPSVVSVKVWWEIKNAWPENGVWSEERKESESKRGIIGGVISSVRDRLR